MGGKKTAAPVPAELGIGGWLSLGAAGAGALQSWDSSCSRELTAGLGSGTDLAPGSVCQMAERQNEEGPEHTGNSPTGVPEFGLRDQYQSRAPSPATSA